MRTRELKGRRSTTKLNDEGKKVWAYTKNEISGKKKEKVKEEQEKRKQKIAELRAKAKVTREQISAKSEREKVSAELKAAVTAAREAYKAAKENLDATYEDLYQQEFDKIASEYKAVKKRKRRKQKQLSHNTDRRSDFQNGEI